LTEYTTQFARSIKQVGTFTTLVMFALLLAGCGGSGDSAPPENPSTDSSTGGTTFQPGLQGLQSIVVDGLAREYRLYLPETNRAAPFKVWMDIALRENLLLIVPDGVNGSNNQKGWNDCRSDVPTNPVVDDVAFITKLLDDVQSRYGNESERVYSTGISNGGQMTMRLADAIPERLSAVAVIAASKPVNSACVDSTQALPIVFMNGTADPILPYEGGQVSEARGIVLSSLIIQLCCTIAIRTLQTEHQWSTTKSSMQVIQSPAYRSGTHVHLSDSLVNKMLIWKWLKRFGHSLKPISTQNLSLRGAGNIDMR